MTRKGRINVLLVLVVLVGLLSSCSLLDRFSKSEEVLLGQYVTLPQQSLEDSVKVRWSIANYPDSSKLTGVMPTDSSDLASFRPDVPGEYEIQLQIIDGDDVETETFKYEVLMPEEGTPLDEAPPPFLKEYLASQPDSTTPGSTSIASVTPTGESRAYLDKLVNPNAPKPTKASKPTTAPRKKTVQRAPLKADPNRAEIIPRSGSTYTIQVAAWPSLEGAQQASMELYEQYGVDNYIQRAFFKDKDEVYYRVRVGNFTSFQAAKTYAENIQKLTKYPAWVDFVRQEM